jgi:hypothetical protein
VQDFFELVNQFPHKIKVSVERINLAPTPLQYRLLCNLTAEWAEDFHPSSSYTYQPIGAERNPEGTLPEASKIPA